MQSIESLIRQRALGFLISIANLSVDSLPRRILAARVNSPNAKRIISYYQLMLSDLNLPDIDQLLALSPKPSLWKSHTKKHLAIKEYLTFLDSCEDYCISSCDKIAL